MGSAEFPSISSIAQRDETPAIGTRFTDPQTAQLSQWLGSDTLIKELAVLIAHRGVVFFPDQDISIEQQKSLTHRLEETPELGKDVSVISSMGGISRAGVVEENRASNGWHSDISFEPVPADFSILKMHTIPEVGGDTLWASGYSAYDKLSPAFAGFLEGLTAIHSAQYFVSMAEQMGLEIQDNRGSAENSGTSLTAIHPVIRTHPITGLKALFVNKSFTTRIVELNTEESEVVLNYLARHISENHDLQVRYRWGTNDVAIWDNRCVFHTGTNDYSGKAREGNRVVGIGEKPYLDPGSKSQRAQKN